MFRYVTALWFVFAALFASADEKFQAAQAKFTQASAGDDLDQKRAALEAFIGLADPAAAPVLATEYARVAEELRTESEALLRSRYALERREVVLANLRTLAERDESAKNLFAREMEKIAELKRDAERSRTKVDDLQPWRDAIADGMAQLFEKLGPSRRSKSEKEVRQDAAEHPDTLVRAASIELIGRIGGPGTALEIHDFLVEADGQIGKLRERVAKTMADVRKLEKRWQDEAAANGGRVAQATAQQYDQVKKDASDATSQIYKLEILIDAAQRAGGIALSRESGKDLEKSMQKLAAALKKGKDRARIDTMGLLTRAKSDAVVAQTRALLAIETEPLGIATLIEGLAGLKDTALIPELIGKYLGHEAWIVRARSAHALASLRSREAIPALIARLEKEEGRTRTDFNQALQSLTGQPFKAVFAVWDRWWKENGGTFQVVEVPKEKSALEEAQEAAGVTFFGINTESQRVLFVLDLSGSMKFAMVPKNNPDDDPQRPPDLPGKGEFSRLEVAKRDLVKALGGLRDAGVFNIVMFASDVWTWSDDPVAMNPDVRRQVSEFIEKADAVGATNVYGSLERALDLCGAKGGGTWSKPVFDTIYFLTDGKATVGVTTDTDEILSFVRERNASAGIVIHTIGLSDAHDAVLMRRLAEENGGIYVGR